MKKIIPFVSVGVLALTPVLASAQALGNITALINSLKTILGILIPMAFGLAILFFFYGIAVYILAAGDASKAKEGKSIMIYGVIAIAVMASVYGLVIWLQSAFGINQVQSIVPPSVPGVN